MLLAHAHSPYAWQADVDTTVVIPTLALLYLFAVGRVGAPRWRIVEVDPGHPSPEQWREIVPEGPDTIQGFVLAGGTLVVHALHDVASQVRLYSLDGPRLGELPLPGPGSAGAFQGRWSDDELFFDFNSYTTPRTTYRATSSGV